MHMKKSSAPKRDEQREDRITMEIIVDAYGPEEQAMGWYYHLDENLQIPFTARCVAETPVSPLRKGEEVEVTGMAPEENCMSEMFVVVNALGRSFGVPLAQLEAPGADEQTQEAIADWHYWVGQGYLLG